MRARHRGFEMGNRKIVLGNYCRYLKWIAVGLVLILALGPMAVAQSAKVLTLEEAVDFALKNYPAVRASLQRVNAAQAGVGLARTSYFPPADMLWQTIRATDNNITGLLPPQSVLAPVTPAGTRRAPNQTASRS